jgi:hypothetical protein
MTSKDTVGSSASDKSDWSSVWEAVSRLAATQESLQEAERHQSASRLTQSAGERQDRRSASMIRNAAVGHEHLSGAIAEIEKASAL